MDRKDDATVRSLVEAAAAQVEGELECTKASREAAEQAQRREWERQQRIQDEKQKTKSMLKSAQQLREYQVLLNYIEEVPRVGRIPTGQLEPRETLEQWLAWAEEKARRLHPLY
jgi:hypothetical protein